MKLFSWNVNGLRAVYKKGFLEWLAKSGADLVCFQETRAQLDQLPFFLSRPAGYLAFFNSANKKGYSGVAVYSRQRPLAVTKKLGLDRFDREGRLLRLDYSHFSLLNLYLPHGGRQKENLEYKLAVYERLLRYLKSLLKKQKNLILMGDFNIAHTEIDLARPKDNQDNIMFTPAEREKLDELASLGFVDSFRRLHPRAIGYYTWWPWRVNARQRNLGWRLDYAWVSKSLVRKLKSASIFSQVFGSDHCPIGLEIAS
jgi:exodeoxyribonuclease-3